MKIAIIGTHSTGKTTLGKLLVEKLRQEGFRVNYLQELARKCPFPINEASHFEAQKWILENQFQHEKNLNLTDGILICDRATIDNFAYMKRAAKNQDLDKYEKLAVDHMPSYDFVFKTIKLNITAENDGVRSVNNEFRDEIDSLISNFLHTYRINHHPLTPTTDYNTHIKHILEKIKNCKLMY